MSRRNIDTLHDALAFQLSNMYDAEEKLKKEIPKWYASYPHLKKELQVYVERCSMKLAKLERIFNYLMEEPVTNQNTVIDKMIEETRIALKLAGTSRVRDLTLTSSLVAISHYKLGVYGCAQVEALELDVEMISDLILEIVNWEKESKNNFSRLTLEEVMYHPADISSN